MWWTRKKKKLPTPLATEAFAHEARGVPGAPGREVTDVDRKPLVDGRFVEFRTSSITYLNRAGTYVTVTERLPPETDDGCTPMNVMDIVSCMRCNRVMTISSGQVWQCMRCADNACGHCFNLDTGLCTDCSTPKIVKILRKVLWG